MQTTPKPSASPRAAKIPKSLLALALVWTISIVLLLMLLTGCHRTRLVVLPSDQVIGFLPKGSTLPATNIDLYLVPPARMQAILNLIHRTN